jgi:hypothetical protein
MSSEAEQRDLPLYLRESALVVEEHPPLDLFRHDATTDGSGPNPSRDVDIPAAPRLGLLVESSYALSVVPAEEQKAVNPQKLLLEYTKFLVSFYFDGGQFFFWQGRLGCCPIYREKR